MLVDDRLGNVSKFPHTLFELASPSNPCKIHETKKQLRIFEIIEADGTSGIFFQLF